MRGQCDASLTTSISPSTHRPPPTDQRAFPPPIKSGYHLDNFQTDVMRGQVTTRPVGNRNTYRKLGVDRSAMIQALEQQVRACMSGLKGMGGGGVMGRTCFAPPSSRLHNTTRTDR